MRTPLLLNAGLLCNVFFNLAAHQSGFAAAHNSDIIQSWHNDYARIQKEIAEYQKSTLSGTAAEQAVRMMNKNARILSSDRDVLDVQLRRLQALMDCLENMPTAPDLQHERNT